MSVAQAVLAAVRINILILAVASAYNIRLFAVKNFGRFLVHIWTGIRILEPYKGPGLFGSIDMTIHMLQCQQVIVFGEAATWPFSSYISSLVRVATCLSKEDQILNTRNSNTAKP